jgi:DNA replication protein DnaC
MLNEYDLLSYCGVPKHIRKTLEGTKDSFQLPFDSPHLGKFWNGGILLYGEVGSGKSTMAAHILHQILSQELYVPRYLEALKSRTLENQQSSEYRILSKYQFVRLPLLLQMIKRSFSKDYEGPSEAELLDQCMLARFLVLDDLGVELTTDWAFQTLYLIVDERYGEERPTVFTSNFSLDKLDQKLNDLRLVSRIVGMCGEHVYEIEGKDRRPLSKNT